jgi:predicted lipid carrier protein YhbT
MAFSPRRDEFPIERARTMVVHATDTDDRWQVTLAPDGITTIRGDGPADVTLTGDASDLYLMLWNRGEGTSITITGDREILDIWHDNVRVRWS